ncbi:GD23586 [Drosophila simulans]|uniref:GD23586 n=1 Tax=Drosophila simulans TaxID=7240 RepID=B4Q7P6_DROSI|nr:GD23586 [Drosophila simulans]
MYIYFPTIFLLFLHPVAAVNPQGFTIKEPKCWYVANPGPCDDFVKVWGYDYLTNRCIFFYYGGCGGNPNRFYTKEECLKTCRVYDHINNVCLLPIWATAIKSNRLKQFESYPDYATYIFLQTPWVIYQQFYVDSVAILTIFDMQFAIFHLLQPYFGCGIWHFSAGCNKFWQRMQMRLMMR